MWNFISHPYKECKVRGFENRVLKRVFGPKREGLTGGRRQLHNEVHNSLKFYMRKWHEKKIGNTDLVRRFSHKVCAVLFPTVFKFRTFLRTRHSRKWDINIVVSLKCGVISRAHWTLFHVGFDIPRIHVGTTKIEVILRKAAELLMFPLLSYSL
jgi:hypothetical protein